MKTAFAAFVSAYVLCAFIGFVGCSSPNHVDTARLLNHLMTGTNRIVRPVSDPETCINVTFDMQLMRITDVHEEENHVTAKYRLFSNSVPSTEKTPFIS